jgi:hypothetical protein
MFFPKTMPSLNSVTTPHTALFIGTTKRTSNQTTFFLHFVVPTCASYPTHGFMILFEEFKL